MGEENQQNAPAVVPAPVPFQVKHSKKLLCYILIAILVVVIGTTVYVWQHSKVVSLTKQLNVANTSNNSKDVQNAISASYVSDVSTGYPLALPHKEVVVSLFLPASTNLLSYTNDLDSQTALASHYTEAVNDIVARWLFSPQGTSTNPTIVGKVNSEIYISSMSQWASTADTHPVQYSAGPDLTKLAALSKAQKQSYISELESETSSCVKNSGHGYQTDDKTFNVCYRLISPQRVGGNYELHIYGFADLDGTPTFLGGSILLPNSYQTELNSYLLQLIKMSVKVQPNPNNP